MFLGNLSTTTERTARKTSSSKSKSKSSTVVDVSEVPSFLDDILYPNGIAAFDIPSRPGSRASRLSPHDLVDHKIIYDRETKPDIPREILLDYLVDCSSMLLRQEIISDIIADSQNLDIGLQEAAVRYQQDVLEYNYKIERKYGCEYLSKIPVLFPSDQELIAAATDYVYAAMTSYLMGLNLRYKNMIANGQKLVASGEFKRKNILEFFEACNSLNAMKETKAIMRKIFETTKEIPNKKAVENQRSLLQIIGYDADFAVSQLNIVNKNYAQDAEILTKMQYFAVSAQISVKEASMNEEERNKFYENIPPMMKHYPHIFVIQQQKQQQEVLQKQQKIQEISGATSVFQSEEGMRKVGKLVERIQIAMETVMEKEDISEWSAERREEYFEKFQSHSMLDVMNNAGTDAVTRISALFDLSDENLEDIVRMQFVMGEDLKVNGNIAKQIRQAQVEMWTAAAKASKEGGGIVATASGSSLQRVGALMASLGSLTNFGRGMEYHGAQQHEECCEHHRQTTPHDVTSGKAEKMIR